MYFFYAIVSSVVIIILIFLLKARQSEDYHFVAIYIYIYILMKTVISVLLDLETIIEAKTCHQTARTDLISTVDKHAAGFKSNNHFNLFSGAN